MIYFAFIFDFIVSTLLPVNSYFVVCDIEKNNIFSVILIGLFLDLIYGKIFINLLILLLFFLILRRIKIKKKYTLIKNTIIYIIYFNIMFFSFNKNFISYFIVFFTGLFMQLLFLKVSKLLLK